QEFESKMPSGATTPPTQAWTAGAGRGTRSSATGERLDRRGHGVRIDRLGDVHVVARAEGVRAVLGPREGGEGKGGRARARAGREGAHLRDERVTVGAR